ncbi:GspH/FimT family pseudopilin [Kangiella aquimarina]|uniref:Type II secretion system protein H n=1 Tax=Kangiella aquimarina TaxID=261965 RepID=A0ABZ0X223_9GAMM|nr:GspH/FimT family pseudopilin [Kangiella aquimarina]WQG84632.1 GspH/FimT family pseudopilin [Kangiella aquimarina]
MTKRVKGLTLIELVVTLGLATILSLIALPHLQEFIAKQKVSADLLKLKSTIETARNQAISKKQSILICGTKAEVKQNLNEKLDCISDWSQVMVMKNEDAVAKEVLHFQQLEESYQLVKWSAFQRKPYLELTPYGFTNHQNGTLYLCHKTYPNLHRAVTISKTGRVTINHDSANLNTKCDSWES